PGEVLGVGQDRLGAARAVERDEDPLQRCGAYTLRLALAGADQEERDGAVPDERVRYAPEPRPAESTPAVGRHDDQIRPLGAGRPLDRIGDRAVEEVVLDLDVSPLLQRLRGPFELLTFLIPDLLLPSRVDRDRAGVRDDGEE